MEIYYSTLTPEEESPNTLQVPVGFSFSLTEEELDEILLEDEESSIRNCERSVLLDVSDELEKLREDYSGILSGDQFCEFISILLVKKANYLEF